MYDSKSILKSRNRKAEKIYEKRQHRGGGNKGLCIHSLRHTYDSIANTQVGANIVNTALAMGHKSISTEALYTHATDEGLASIVRTFYFGLFNHI